MNILIVDDDYVSRTKMRTVLQDLGTCTDEESSLKALDVFKKALDTGKPFDLVTLDIQMPDLDGYGLLREIHAARAVGKRPRCVAMTANALNEDREKCLHAGFDAFLPKPFSVQQLAEAVKGVMAA